DVCSSDLAQDDVGRRATEGQPGACGGRITTTTFHDSNHSDVGIFTAPREACPMSAAIPSQVNSGSKPAVTIVGAGIIGIATAIQLQRAGHPVTIIDRKDPAESCSRGNAGILAAYGVAPLSLPGILGKVPGILMDPLGPLSIRRQYLLNIAPWLWRFWRASRPDRVEQIAAALSGLLSNTVADYHALTRGAAAEALIK